MSAFFYLLSFVFCLLSFAAALSAQQPPRDAPAAVPAGSAAIAGVLITDEPAPRPIRRAFVTLTPSGGRPNDAMVSVTDDDGRFAFGALRSGRYTLSASKPAFVNAAYGATRPGRPGTPLQLADGQRLTSLVMKMARGAVITGLVRDQNGEPIPAARIGLMRYVFQPQNGERVLQPVNFTGTTDDRGAYRIYGITPGEYFVQLQSPFTLPGDVQLTTDQGLQAAAQALRVPAGAPAPPESTTRVAVPTVAWAPVFYPGTTTAENAVALPLAAAEERSGIDLQFQMVRTARIQGTVSGEDGAPAPNAQVSVLGAGPQGTSIQSMLASMFGGGRPDAQGQFMLSGIAPGHYTVAARVGGGFGRGAGPNSPARTLWATAEVDVNGQDVSGVRLILEPGLRVSGRLVYEGGPAPDPIGVRISVTPMLTGASVAMVAQPVQPGADGGFTLEGITPGRYQWATSGANLAGGRQSGPGPGVATPGWLLRSALVRGRETIDTGVDIRAGEPIADAVLTFSNRPAGLEGTLQDASGRPASDYFIVLYPSDKALWAPPARRVAMTRPASDGRFAVRSVPPGDYLVAAVTDVEGGEWRDPAFLAQLVPASIKVTLTDGRLTTQDIRIARAP